MLRKVLKGCIIFILFTGILCFFAVGSPVAALICGVLIYMICRHKKDKKRKTNKYQYINFDTLNGYDFEKFCADLLKDNGFSMVEVTQGSGDHGIDILASICGKKYAIQCKCHSKNIGNKAVQEAYSGKAIYNANIAVVMTNRFFTKQAIGDARKLNVLLWDRNKLLDLIRKAKDENSDGATQ